MSEHSFVIVFASIYLFISLICVSSAEYVPVYMWETTQFSEIVPALERVSPESFKNILSQRAVKDTPVLLFAEENLSPEDFALHGGDGKSPFQQLSSLKDSAQISYWPFVKSPIKAIKELPERNIVETFVKSILKDEDFMLKNNDVLVVDLNDAREGEDRVHLLQRHDKDIHTIYNKFAKQHKNIITFFTGHHSSWIVSEELRTHRRVRDTTVPKAGEESNHTDTGIIYKNTDVLIHVTAVPTLFFNGTNVTLQTFSLSTGEKNETNMQILFKSATKTDIIVGLNFNFSGGYWLLSDISVHNDSLPENEKDYNLVTRNVYAPVGFSYHCNSTTFFNFKNPNQNMTFPGLQMQPYFNITDEIQIFGDAYDCVGFMSAPIWSGIFVTFILALIMTFGLTMMMDIKTMDRFDDPKGKTITISATE